MKVSDKTGKRFGFLTVVRLSHLDIHKKAMWLCKCDCGNFKIVSGCNLKSGCIKSCGCYRDKVVKTMNVTHGMTDKPIYNSWMAMKARCYNKKNHKFQDYGGRGITICDEWLKSFTSFYLWSLKNGYAPGLSIDRVNNDGNYEPDNCRWATAKEQANNRRARRWRKKPQSYLEAKEL